MKKIAKSLTPVENVEKLSRGKINVLFQFSINIYNNYGNCVPSLI